MMFKSTGKKTFTAGVGLIVMGVIQLGLYLLDPDKGHSFGGPTEAIQRIMEGVALIGIRAKLNAVEPRERLRTPKEEEVWESLTEEEKNAIRGSK